MKRIMGTSLVLVLGGIVIVGACELESPAISDRDDAELEAVDEAPSGLVDEIEADSTPVFANSCGDCRDGKSDTFDWCNPRGKCKHKKRWKCEDKYSYCEKHKDCLEGDSYTVDWCYQRKCHHADRWTGDCEY